MGDAQVMLRTSGLRRKHVTIGTRNYSPALRGGIIVTNEVYPRLQLLLLKTPDPGSGFQNSFNTPHIALHVRQDTGAPQVHPHPEWKRGKNQLRHFDVTVAH